MTIRVHPPSLEDGSIHRLLAALRRCIGTGSQAAYAKQLGVSPAYLSDVLLRKREPGPAILTAIGWTKQVTYRRTVTYATTTRKRGA